MKVIAHRGASSVAPENTIAAIIKAIEMGAHGVEVDVHLTLDGKLVVIHDESTSNVSLTNFKIKDSTYKDLSKLDVGTWFHPQFKDQRIPLLEDVINLIPEYMELFIEIKPNIEILDSFYNFIKNYYTIKHKLFLMSFNYNLVEQLKRLLPNFNVLWVVEFGYNIEKRGYNEVIKKIEKAKLDGIAQAADLNDCLKLRDAIKKLNLYWNVWTVDNAKLAIKLKNIGVNSITTNRPDLILNILS